jgi:hypothetical protein
MSNPQPRDPKDVKKQALEILKFYQEGIKDKYLNDPYFDGYRAAVQTMIEVMEANLRTEI